MTLVQTIRETEYSETDDQLMGETDLHRNWMTRLVDRLSYYHHDRRVYVSCNLLVYFEEGASWRYIVPDVFVAIDTDPRERRVFAT